MKTPDPGETGVEARRQLHHRLLEAVLEDAVGVLDPRAHVLRRLGGREVGQFHPDDLVDVDGHAVGDGIAGVADRAAVGQGHERALLDVGDELARLGDDQGEDAGRGLHPVVGKAVGVGELEVLEHAEELEEHPGHRIPLVRVLDARG